MEDVGSATCLRFPPTDWRYPLSSTVPGMQRAADRHGGGDAEAFVSLWDWSGFRPIDGTEAHPDDASVGLRLKNAPETALRSAPGHFFHGTQAHAVGLRLTAGESVGLGLANGGTQTQRSWDSGSRIGETQAQGAMGTSALCLSLAYATGAQMAPAMRLRAAPSEVSCD